MSGMLSVFFSFFFLQMSCPSVFLSLVFGLNYSTCTESFRAEEVVSVWIVTFFLLVSLSFLVIGALYYSLMPIPFSFFLCPSLLLVPYITLSCLFPFLSFSVLPCYWCLILLSHAYSLFFLSLSFLVIGALYYSLMPIPFSFFLCPSLLLVPYITLSCLFPFLSFSVISLYISLIFFSQQLTYIFYVGLLCFRALYNFIEFVCNV